MAMVVQIPNRHLNALHNLTEICIVNIQFLKYSLQQLLKLFLTSQASTTIYKSME